MNLTINTIKGDKDINIEYSHQYIRTGQWYIVAWVSFQVGNTIWETLLRHYTKDLVFYEKIANMIHEKQLSEDIEQLYHDTFFSEFEESIKEFVCKYE